MLLKRRIFKYAHCTPIVCCIVKSDYKTPLFSKDKNTRITKSTVGFRTKKVFNFVLFYKTYLSNFFG